MVKEKGKMTWKSALCILLASVMLSQTVLSPVFVPLPEREVEANPIAYPAIKTLLLVILVACGYSVASDAEGDALCSAFCDWFEAVKDHIADIGAVSDASKAASEYNSLKLEKAGKSVLISAYSELCSSMKYFVTKVLPNYVSKAESYDGTAGGKYAMKACCNTKITQKAINYLKQHGLYTGSVQSFLDGRNMSMFLLVVKSTACYLYYYSDSVYPYSGQPNYYSRSPYAFCVDDEGLLRVCKPGTDELWTGSNYNNFSYISWKRSSVTEDFKPYLSYGSPVIGTTQSLAYENFNPANMMPCYINAPVFTSIDELNAYVANFDKYKNITGIFGDGTAAFELPADATITAGDNSLSDQIAAAIADALSNSSSGTLTADQVNEIVNSSITDYSDSLSDIKDSTDSIGSGVAFTNAWLGKIYTKICEISSSLSKPTTDGSSALSIDDSDAFTVIQGGGGNSNPDPNDDDPKIWFAGSFMAASFLKPVLEYFGQPLSLITKWLNSIKKTLDTQVTKQNQIISDNSTAATNVLSAITSLPGSIFGQFTESLGSIISYLQQIAVAAAGGATTLTNLPGNMYQYIKQAIEDAMKSNPLKFPESIPLEVPDLNLKIDPLNIPILGDILAVLQAICEAVMEFFSFDSSAVDQAIEALKGKMYDKVPYDRLVRMFDTNPFTNDYEYPVISIKTPNIIKIFYPSEELILFNGEDYAGYFVFFRSLLRAMCWLAYAYACIGRLKVYQVMN